MDNVRKLVLPVAGMGTRLRPLTLKTPKALVSLAGVPLLEYVLNEAKDSGIKDVALVISPDHKPHFQKYIKERGKRFPGFKLSIHIQKTPRGNGHALLQAADMIGNQPFAVRFVDDIILHQKPVLLQLNSAFSSLNAPVLLLEKVPKKEVFRYGVVEAKKTAAGLHRISTLVEKPAVEDAPSNLTIVGGYVLTPAIMDHLARLENSTPDITDALPLTRAFEQELLGGGKIYGLEFKGKRLDCGTLAGLQNAEEYLKKINE